MDYQYENLGHERFQEFCQSLLLNEYKDFQVFPVGQPDGGRDAVSFLLRRHLAKFIQETKFIVYQVKYVRDSNKIDDPHKWLMDIIEGEAPKIEKLILKGAQGYCLLTNVKGTAHLDGGSIDKVSKILKNKISIPTFCWWRDDLSRRLDNNCDLKWLYPELLTGLDMLRHVIKPGFSEAKERRYNAIKAYLRDQYELDNSVKFKQIELQNKLLDLFIDVPIIIRSSKDRGWHFPINSVYQDISRRHLDGPEQKANREQYFSKGQNEELEFVGASTLLLSHNGQQYIPRIVIEGGPGQGKSTIVQYVCQVHRMRMLNNDEALKLIRKHHVETPVKIPLKIDLWDFSSWIKHRNPFPELSEDLFNHMWKKSLEAFLFAHISNNSGGVEFTVNDLLEVVKLSSILIVLDGFDEVADIEVRQEIVSIISRCINRLNENAISLQVIITSRPAAFSNSPGFPDEHYPHFELDAINRFLINQYADKWAKAKKLDKIEDKNIKRILNEKLEQAHISELAKNPMQLAILISYIHTKGESLPDKRTALYDSYIDLFLNREA